MSRQDRFDENREVDQADELNEAIRRQEEVIHQLQQQAQQHLFQQQQSQ